GWAARCSSVSASTTSAARRYACTRRLWTRARSRRYAISRSAATGSITSPVRPAGIPARDLLRRPWPRSRVPRGGTYQPAGALLLQDVRAPPGGPGAGEHRGEHVRRHLGEVEHDRRPELHVRLQHPVRAALSQLRERRLLQLLRDLVAGGLQLLGGAAQHPCPGVLGAVDAVAESHQPFAAVQQRLHVRAGVAGLLHLSD